MANIVVDNADPNAVFGVGSSTPAQKPTPAPTANPGLVEDPADPSKVFSSTPVHKSSTGIVADNANPNDVFGHEYTPPSYSANAPTYEKSMLNDVGQCTGRECGEEISHYLPQSVTSLDQPQNFVQPDSHGNYPEGTIMHVAPDADRGRFDAGHYFVVHYINGVAHRLESNVVGPDEVSDSRPLSPSDIDAATRGGVVHAYMPPSANKSSGQPTVNNPSTDSSLDSAANNVPPNLFAGGTSGQFTPAQLADLQKNFTPAQIKQFVSMKQQEGLIGNVVPMAGAKVEGLEDQHAIQNQLQYEHDQNAKRAQENAPTIQAPSQSIGPAPVTPTDTRPWYIKAWDTTKNYFEGIPNAVRATVDPQYNLSGDYERDEKDNPVWTGAINMRKGLLALPGQFELSAARAAERFGQQFLNGPSNPSAPVRLGVISPSSQLNSENPNSPLYDKNIPEAADLLTPPGAKELLKAGAEDATPFAAIADLANQYGNAWLKDPITTGANTLMTIAPFLHMAIPHEAIPESLPATDVIDSSLGAKASTPARNGMTPKASMPKSTISEGLSTAADQFTEQAKQVQDPEAAQALNAVASTLNDASVAAKPFDDEPAKAAQAGSAIIKQNPQVTYLAHKISGLSDHDAMLATWGGEEPAKATVTPPAQDYSPTNKIPATPIEGTETQPQGQAQPIPPPVAENATVPLAIQSGEEVPGAHMRTPVPEPTPSVAPSENWGSFNPNKVQTTPEGLAQIRAAAERGGWLDKTPLTDEDAIKQASQIPYDADMLRKLTPGQIPDGIPANTWAVYVSQADAHFGEGAADAAAVMRDAIDTNKANPTPDNQSAEDVARSAYEKAQQDLDIAHAHDQRVPNELGTGLQGHKIVVFNRRNAATSAALRNAPSLQDIGAKLQEEPKAAETTATADEPSPVKPPRANSGTSKPVKRVTVSDEQFAKDKAFLASLKADHKIDILNDEGGAVNHDVFAAHIRMGAYNIESGIINFSKWLAKMREDTGSKFSPSYGQRIYGKAYIEVRKGVANDQKPIVKSLIMDQHAGHFGSRLNAAKFVDAIADADANNPNPGRSNTILDNYMHGHPMDEYQKNVIADADAKFAKTTRPAPTNNALTTTNNIVKEGMKAAVKEKAQAAQLARMEAAADKAAGDKLKNAAEQAQRIADRKAVQAKLAQDRADANKANKEAAQLAKQAAIDAQKAAKDAQSAMDNARNESIKADQREQARQDKLDKKPIKEGLEADQKTRAAQQRFNTAQVKADAKGSPLSNMGAKVAARDAADARVDRSINSRTVKATFDRFGARSDGAVKVRADLASTGDSGIIDKLKNGEQLTNEEGRRFAQAIDAYKKTAPTPGGNDISKAITKTMQDARAGRLGYDSPKAAVTAEFERGHPINDGDTKGNQAKIDAFNRDLALVADNDHHGIGLTLLKHDTSFVGNVTHFVMGNILSGIKTVYKILIDHGLTSAAEELRRMARTPSSSVRGVGNAAISAIRSLPDARDVARFGPLTAELSGKSPLHEVGSPLSREFTSGVQLADTYMRAPMRAHGSIYHVLQTYAYERHLYANAEAIAKAKGLTGKDFRDEVASLRLSPPDDLRTKSIKDAKEETLVNDNKLSGSFNKLAAGNGTVGRIAKAINLPVARVPFNSLGRQIEQATGLFASPVLARVYEEMHPNATPDEIAAYKKKVFERGLVGLGIGAAGFVSSLLGVAKGPDAKHYEYGHITHNGVDTGTSGRGNVGGNYNLGATINELRLEGQKGKLPFNNIDNGMASIGHIASRMGENFNDNNPIVRAASGVDAVNGTDPKAYARQVASVLSMFTPYSAFSGQTESLLDHDVRSKKTIGDFYKNATGYGRESLPPLTNHDTGNPYMQPNFFGSTPSLPKSAQAHSDQMNAVSDILASEKGNYTEAENNSYNAANYLRAQAREGVPMDGPNGLQAQADRLHKANVLSLQDMITFKEHPNESPSASGAYRLASLGQLVDAYPKLAAVTSPADMADFKRSVILSYYRFAEKGADSSPPGEKRDILTKLGAFAP